MPISRLPSFYFLHNKSVQVMCDADLVHHARGRKAMPMALSCSICFEPVMDRGDRSWAKLQCAHQFHLDCIGSAFNIKGAMQCPKCRIIEKGQWLYANGSRPLPEFNMDDWAHDEDLYDLGYSGMSFGVHWCPFSGFTRIPASFDEGEFSSSASHPCPYITYFGPLHPSSTSSVSVSYGSSHTNHWRSPSVQSDVPSSYGFPSMVVHYHGWAHSPPFATGSHVGAADQPSIPSVNPRAAIYGYNMPRPGMPPFIVGHSSGSRTPSSATMSVLPPYHGIVVRPRDHSPSLQAYFPQSNNPPMAQTPLVSTGRRSSSRRGLAQVVPINSSSDQSDGLYFYSPNSSGRTFQEPVDRDSMWGLFHPPTGGSETGM